MIRIQNIPLPIAGDLEELKKSAARILSIKPEEISSMSLVRKSIDARKKNDVHYVCSVNLSVTGEAALVEKTANPNVVLFDSVPYAFPQVRRTSSLPPVVVGMGPASPKCCWE